MPAEKILQSAKSLAEFINKGPSPFHVVKTCSESLQQAGFQLLSEKEQWNLELGGKYFCTRNQSSLVAFAIGDQYKAGNGFSIIGAHTDSPCLKIKPKSTIKKCGFLQVGVQCYGGGIWHTWFDRDLTIAGRVLVKSDIGYEHRLVHVEKPILKIPNICIHLNREMNDMHKVNKETHLVPILSTEEFDKSLNAQKETVTGEASKHHSALITLICKELSCKPEDLMDLELCLADTQPAQVGGLYDEFIFAPRLDNLFNTFCSLQGLIQSTKDGLATEENVQMIALYDNEEVGSQSQQGAASLMTESILRRINQQFAGCFEQSLANSFLISADQAHGVHPNYEDKHEGNHKPMFHSGPVLKVNANQRYATSGITASILRIIAEKCDVPLQDVVVKNDSACGSTIGPILAARLGVQTVDIGGPQLSMHSIRETCCTSSVEQTIRLFHSFFKEYPQVQKSIQGVY